MIDHRFFVMLVKQAIWPPGGIIIILLIIALLARWKYQNLASWISLIVAVGLFVLSNPLIAHHMMRSLEHPPLIEGASQHAEAIVIFSAGSLLGPEYGGITVASPGSLSRALYGAYLERATGLPVLITGGRPGADGVSEAESIRRILEEELNVSIRWIGHQARDTLENARETHALLAPEGIKRVLLISGAFTMRRAAAALSAFGFDVIPAPTTYRSFPDSSLLGSDFIPTLRALNTNLWAIEEYMGFFLAHML